MIYAITSSASASSIGGTVRPSAFVVFAFAYRLISLFGLDRTSGESLSNLISAAASPLVYAFRGDAVLLFYVLAFTPL